jgi:hypothetical protein
MLSGVRPQTSVGGLERPVIEPLDEATWQTWVAKGRMGEQRRSAARVKAAKLVSIAGLLAVAGLWSHLAPFEVVIRFIVAAAALIVMFGAFNAKHYLIAAVSATLVLLYNPLAPVFTFSGDWHQALVLASAVPFLVSLVWRTSMDGTHASI